MVSFYSIFSFPEKLFLCGSPTGKVVAGLTKVFFFEAAGVAAPWQWRSFRTVFALCCDVFSFFQGWIDFGFCCIFQRGSTATLEKHSVAALPRWKNTAWQYCHVGKTQRGSTATLEKHSVAVLPRWKNTAWQYCHVEKTQRGSTATLEKCSKNQRQSTTEKMKKTSQHSTKTIRKLLHCHGAAMPAASKKWPACWAQPRLSSLNFYGRKSKSESKLIFISEGRRGS